MNTYLLPFPLRPDLLLIVSLLFFLLVSVLQVLTGFHQLPKGKAHNKNRVDGYLWLRKNIQKTPFALL